MQRSIIATLAWAAASVFAAGAVHAQTPDKIRIGYAISKTGPFAGGAGVTTLPNYQVWVKDVNAAGGIMLGGKRVPIEVVEYDDRSNSEEAVKAIERLATQDKVDFILPPWGTGLNLAVGADLQPPRLSASRRHGGDRPRARAGEALAEQLLVPRHVEARRRSRWSMC